MTVRSFVSQLARYEGENVFNPYRDVCVAADLQDAADRRQANLRAMLDACLARGVDTIWVARDLGYRGGRRTGLPLTDEAHLNALQGLFGTQKVVRATKDELVAERTATTIWQVLAQIGRPIMLWNVFPFHPHEADNPFSNRCHSRAEREATLPYLWDLVDLLKPKKLVAIGRDAQRALTDAPVEMVEVRHPSYGGQREFVQKLYEVYGIDDERGTIQNTTLRHCPA